MRVIEIPTAELSCIGLFQDGHPETRTLVTITSEWAYPYKYAGQEIGVYVRDRDAMYVGTLLDPYGKEVQLVLDRIVHHAGCLALSMTRSPSL